MQQQPTDEQIREFFRAIAAANEAIRGAAFGSKRAATAQLSSLKNTGEAGKGGKAGGMLA